MIIYFNFWILILKLFLFSILIISNVLGYSQLFKKIFKIDDDNLLNNYIYGSSIMVLFSYSINFFLPLSPSITNSLFLFFSLIGIFKLYQNIKKNLPLLILILVTVFVIFLYSPSYNDYELYHLPYMELIRKFKIIFGISNLDFRYAHSSVFQNISAIQYNSLMKLDSYIFHAPILSIIILIFLFRKLKTSSNFLIFIFSLVSLIYFILHGSRYGSLGNDLPAHLLAIYALILFIEICEGKSREYFLFLNIIFLLIFSKFSLIFYLLLPIYIIFKEKSLFLGLSKLKIIFLIGLVLLFLIKNFINSSCLIYPLSFSCFDVKWSPKEYSFGSAKTISKESSVMVKAYMEADSSYISKIRESTIQELMTDSIYENLNKSDKEEFIKFHVYEEYSKIKNWFPIFLKSKDFKKFLNKSLLLNFILFLIFFYLVKRKKFSPTSDSKIFLNFNYKLFLIIFISISFIFWLFSFPQLRYGISYALLFCSIPNLIYFNIYFHKKNMLVFYNFAKFLILLAIAHAIFTNLIRISQKISIQNNFSLFSNIVTINTVDKISLIKVNNFNIIQPHYGVCSNLEQLCSVFAERFYNTNRGIYLSNLNYLFIY